MGAHYVDNAMFYKALCERRELVDLAIANNQEKPRVTNYIGYCIMQIAHRLCTRSVMGNFMSYSYKDEMINDGIENAIVAIDSFDVTKGDKPFSYFTLVIFRAFLRRLEQEKKQAYIKGKLIQEIPVGAFDGEAEDSELGNESISYYLANQNFDDSFIVRKEKAKAKAKAKALEKKQALEKEKVSPLRSFIKKSETNTQSITESDLLDDPSDEEIMKLAELL